MKFKRIIINNFMRYKGRNEIAFSTDPDKNVTVVLGDNTHGKTTIAQAFRWALYGEVISTNYDEKSEITLLNKEVLAGMTVNDRAKVSVEIEVEEGKNNYRFCRVGDFVRKGDTYIAIEQFEKLTMAIQNDRGEWEITDNDGDSKGKNKGIVEDQINVFFPQNLSNYFLFDGERWNSDKTKTSDIKQSISTIIGVGALDKMKYHLIEYGTSGSKSVIKTLKRKAAGNDSKTNEILKEIDFLSKSIDRATEAINSAKNAQELYQKRYEQSREILDSNKKIEEEQREAKRLEDEISITDKRIKADKAELVKSFSRDSYKFIMGLVADKCKAVIDGAGDLDGSDIPNVNDQTIYYILDKGRCICGNKVCDGSESYQILRDLLNVVPPKMIGGEIQLFNERIKSWADEVPDIYDRIKSLAESIEVQNANYSDYEDELYHLNKKIDKKMNFAQERARMNEAKSKAEGQAEIIRKNENNIKDFERQTKSLEEELETIAQKNKEAQKYAELMAYAEALLEKTEKELENKEVPLRGRLNDKIKSNFETMFKERDKYAQLGDDYKLHLYYRKLNEMGTYSTVEETSLSEGEKIAANFVFIVSILELAQEYMNEEEDKEMILSLPLVLDAPFSKLSEDNTALISKVLPDAAEQVIIFMLDKDWDASGLEKYADKVYQYRVKKDKDSNSSSIVGM